jgi:hypothetical protein
MQTYMPILTTALGALIMLIGVIFGARLGRR